MKNTIFYTTVVIFFTWFFFKNTEMSNTHALKIYKSQLKGIIVSKESPKGAMCLVLENGTAAGLKTCVDNYNAFETAHKNDLFVKLSNSNKGMIIRRDSIYKFNVYDYSESKIKYLKNTFDSHLDFWDQTETDKWSPKKSSYVF